eukprot:7974288-Alexandrium_andersonii.AAC.1
MDAGVRRASLAVQGAQPVVPQWAAAHSGRGGAPAAELALGVPGPYTQLQGCSEVGLREPRTGALRDRR